MVSPLIDKGVDLGKKAMHKLANRRFKAKNGAAAEKKDADGTAPGTN